MSSLTAATIQQVNVYDWKLDPTSVAKTHEVCAEVSEYFHRMANEPSIGLYHVTTHMFNKGIPRVQSVKEDLQKCTKDCDNALAYDVTESLRSVRAMHELVALKNTKVREEKSREVRKKKREKEERPDLCFPLADFHFSFDCSC